MTKTWILICSASLTFLVVDTIALGQDQQEAQPLMTLEINKTQVPLDLGERVVGAEAEFLLDIDPLVLLSNPEVLSLDLYKGVALEAHRYDSMESDAWRSWSGHLYFPEILGTRMSAGEILLVDNGDSLSGIIDVFATRQAFQIVSSSSVQHRLIKMGSSRIPSCVFMADQKLDDSLAAHWDEDPGGTEMFLASQATSVIDVLAIIKFGEDSQQTRNFINTSVAAANQAFANSLVNASYTLKATVVASPILLPPQLTVSAYLAWMNQPAGKAYIEGLRTSFRADMVVLFVQPEVTDGCGIANLPYRNPQGQIRYVGGSGQLDLVWNDEAYSVQAIGCGLNDVTFAHELGHNYGLRHDENDWGGSLAPPYSPIDPHPRGHEFGTIYGEKASVMGCVGNSAPCYRVSYFSDPNITVPFYGLEPTGSYADHSAAAEALRVRTTEYKLFR